MPAPYETRARESGRRVNSDLPGLTLEGQVWLGADTIRRSAHRLIAAPPR